MQGINITFAEKLHRSIIKKEFNFSSTERIFIEENLRKFLEKGIIELIDEDLKIQFITNIFLREKSDGSFRTILNLKELNSYVQKTHFKMDTLKTSLKLITHNCFFAKVDLKDAFFSVPVSEDSKRFLRFSFYNTLYEFQCMPQGYSDAPRVFTKITKPLIARLRSLGFINSIYIDDILLISDNKTDLEENISHTLSIFDRAGFTINTDKSVLVESQTIEFLGFFIDSVELNVKPTVLKSKKVRALCIRYLEENTKFTIRELSELIRNLVALQPGNKYATLFYKRLEIFRNSCLKRHRGDYNKKIRLTGTVKSDIAWWIDNVDTFPCEIYPKPVSHKLKSDASLSGWGAFDVNSNISSEGVWSQDEKEQHINLLEIMAVFICLKIFCSNCTNKHVQIYCDNMTALTSINKMGSNKIKINNLVREIWNWCKDKKIDLTVSYIAGKDNVEADKASREHNYNLEWSIKNSVFSDLVKHFGQFDVDLFASRINYKVKPYASWKPDPEAKFTNAFHLTWNFNLAYCFPPFYLIPSVLQKVILDQADIVLVGPLWPSQVWFPKMLSLLVEDPIVFSKRQNILYHPMCKFKVHPLSQKLNIFACRLSGKIFKTRDYQKNLEKSSFHHGDLIPINNTTLISGNGCHFVRRGRLIPFHMKKTI